MNESNDYVAWWHQTSINVLEDLLIHSWGFIDDIYIIAVYSTYSIYTTIVCSLHASYRIISNQYIILSCRHTWIDTIVHNAAALALLRIGVSHKRISSMFSTIQRMTHRIRTAFGDSDITYGGEDFVGRGYYKGMQVGQQYGQSYARLYLISFISVDLVCHSAVHYPKNFS